MYILHIVLWFQSSVLKVLQSAFQLWLAPHCDHLHINGDLWSFKRSIVTQFLARSGPEILSLRRYTFRSSAVVCRNLLMFLDGLHV